MSTITTQSLAKKAACTLLASGMICASGIGFANVEKALAADDYTYCYAGLSWEEYWAGEGVYNATDTTSSDELDLKGESDLGGFDAVSRATANHGLHRGSYQCNATLHAKADDGTTRDFSVATWSSDGKTFTTTDGTEVSWNRGKCTVDGKTYTMTDYNIYGTKYVPVKVKTSDYAAFKADREAKGFTVTENGATLAGGYGEGVLKSYTATADVNASTYGIKTATKSGSSFSFSKADESATQTGSGIAGQELKTVTTASTADATDGVYVMVGGSKDATFQVGAYGEKIRVDLAGNYGDLGANMQSVTWAYYGKDKTGKKAVRTYGTKFAADNWMHKSMHIQLGLTESKRFTLPKGYDGTGYWTLTVHALGYKDYTTPVFKITDDNFSKLYPVSKATKSSLKAVVTKAQGLIEANYTAESWKNLGTELAESTELLANADATEAAVLEQITHMSEAVEKLAYADGVADNKLTLKSKKATFKAKALKKGAKTVKIKASVPSKAKVSDTASTGIKVSKSGKVTLKKGTKKGTYTVTVTAAEAAGYKSAAAATFTVKVK